MFKWLSSLLAFVVLSVPMVVQTAAAYPTRPITIVVPWGAGGGSDQMVRALVRSAENVSDIKFVVQNMPGASGLAGLNYVMQQPADGYTIYQVVTDQLVQMAMGVTKFKLGDDIQPLMRSQAVTNLLFIRADDDRFQTFEELVEYAKANDGEVSIGTTGLHSFDSAMIKSIEDHYGFKFKNMPFDNPAERYAALQGGFTDVMFEQIGDVIQFVQTGTYKPVVAYSDERLDGYDDVPTTVELGIDNTIAYSRGLWVKSDTPQEVMDYLTEVFAKAVETEEWRKVNDAQQMLSNSYLDSAEFQTDLDRTFSILAP